MYYWQRKCVVTYVFYAIYFLFAATTVEELYKPFLEKQLKFLRKEKSKHIKYSITASLFIDCIPPHLK